MAVITLRNSCCLGWCWACGTEREQLFKPGAASRLTLICLGSLMDESGDREHIDRLIAGFFAAFDNRHGAIPTLDAILDCFAEKAVIARSGGSDAQLFTPVEFAAPRIDLLASGTLLDFHEAEIDSSTSILG